MMEDILECDVVQIDGFSPPTLIFESDMEGLAAEIVANEKVVFQEYEFVEI
jgi:hypothetical protein